MRQKVQSQPLRIECPDYWSLATSRTINSLLWFVNNPTLEEHILRYLARYQEKHGIELFAFVLMGNHDHTQARFPNMNRAAFFRDFNARTSEGVRYFVPQFPGGPVFARRYSEQALAEEEEVEEYFFYCALQPVKAGLSEYIKDYPGYNSFHDAISGRPRLVRDFDSAAFNSAKRFNRKVKKKDFTVYRKIYFTRIPGYADLSQHDYRVLMLKKLEERRVKLVEERRAAGKGFLGPEALRRVKPGTAPLQTKRSKRDDPRPLILTKRFETKKAHHEFYFGTLTSHMVASKRFRAGDLTVQFPVGTYRPPSFVPT